MTKKKMIICVVMALLTTNFLHAQSNIGVDYYLLGDYVKAKDHLTKDLASNPALNNYYLGEVAFAEENPTLAAEFYNKGLSADPASVLNQIGLLKLKLKSDPQNTEKALTDISKKNKKDVDAQVIIGRAYLDNGLIAQARKALDAAKKANSKNPSIYILKGDIILGESGDAKKLGEAAAEYEQAIYFDANYLLGYMKTAQVYEKINPNDAISRLKTVIEKNPNYMPAYGLIGKIYTQNGLYPQAIEAYKKYMSSGIYSLDDIEKYARAEYFVIPKGTEAKDKDYTEAKKIVGEGLKINPNHPILNRFLMYISAKTNNTDEGLATASKFFSIRDTGFIGLDYSAYATLLAQAKKFNEAYAEFDKAITLEPDKTELYDEAASTARSNKEYAQAAYFIQKKITESIKDNGDPEFKGDLIDVTTLGSDLYSAGSNILKNLPLAEELKNDPAVIEAVKAFDNSLIMDSLNDAGYFAKAYSKYNLNKADAVFDTQIILAPESYTGYRYKALINNALNPDVAVGQAKPYYEKVIEILTAPDYELTNTTKRILIESYIYIGFHYYMNDDKDNTIKFLSKVLELDPENKNAKDIIEDVNKRL